MVGARADNADANAVAFIPAGEAIDDVDAFPGVEVVNGTLTVDTPDLGGCVSGMYSPGTCVSSQNKVASARMADTGQPSPDRHVQGCEQRTSPSGRRLALMTSVAEFHKLNRADLTRCIRRTDGR